MTRSLLYVAAKGKTNGLEVSEMLGYNTGYRVPVVLKTFEKQGILQSAPRLYKTAPLDYTLNPDYFAAKPMRRLLQNLLTLYPDIRRLATLAKKYRFKRSIVKNRNRPHLKGLSR